MRELEFLEIIKQQLEDCSYIGDDCAYLSDLGIFITQDTLVQEVHFSSYSSNAYFLGRKAVNVNLSDLAAAMAEPAYITVSLSLPKQTKDDFVSELYRGINDVCAEYGVKTAGGDITGSDKIVISVCAIGRKVSKYISSRSFAKKGDYIAVTGNFGASAAGFHALSNYLYAEDALINAHLNPKARIKEGLMLAGAAANNTAVMDASDGLIDAVYKIAHQSRHSVSIDLNKIPVLPEMKAYCARNNLDYKQSAKWGGEDYELIACIDEETLKKLEPDTFTVIGRVLNKDTNPSVSIIDGKNEELISAAAFENNSFNHF